MDTITLKALEYGVLGLCCVMLLAVTRVITVEQRRAGQPRRDILRYGMIFMLFCLLLAALNGYVQLTEGVRIRIAEDRQHMAEEKVRRIKAAMEPLFATRASVIEQLPNDLPQKKLLLKFQEELLKALQDKKLKCRTSAPGPADPGRASG